MPDGTTIVVENGVIAEIRPKEETAPEGEQAGDEEKGEDTTTELDDRDEEEQRLRDRIAELEKENFSETFEVDLTDFSLWNPKVIIPCNNKI